MKTNYEDVLPNQEEVFKRLDCTEDNPAYEEMLGAYEELLGEVRRKVKGKSLLGIGRITPENATLEYPAGTKVIYVISTIGKEFSELSSELFQTGDYLKGTLADAMADSCLFALEEQWQKTLEEFCEKQKIGIKKRLYPTVELPITVHKAAYECLNAKEELDIGISSGYMYRPLKTLCQVFVISEDMCDFNTVHDCRNCSSVNCKMRKDLPVRITLNSLDRVKEIFCYEKDSILDAYQRQIGDGSAICAGTGYCGKCKIRLINGELPITESDRSLLSERELKEGYRLACKAYPKGECNIEICFLREDRLAVLESYAGKSGKLTAPDRNLNQPIRTGIAIDVGTTTLAAQLINIENGEIVDTVSSVNHQRMFGADVISRINSSNKGNKKELQNLIKADLNHLIQRLLEQNQLSETLVEQVVLAGNTAMGHLLLGYSCETLGVFPFKPVNVKMVKECGAILLENNNLSKSEAYIMPGISAYVGGDIVAGLYACEFEKNEEVNLLIDLGTNGEMAIGNQERILVTSTAAGPAFEGGNISSGVASIPGAICHFSMNQNRENLVETIQNQMPIGICGTGVLDIMAELLKNEIIDDTGLLDEEYFVEGFPLTAVGDNKSILFTQKDVREVQLAKAAIRTGIELLIKKYQISYERIGRVFLAGGMGFSMNCAAAVAIGMLPKELESKVEAVGNSALAGTTRAMQDLLWKEKVHHIVEISEEIVLAKEKSFNELYMENMVFEIQK